MKRWFYVRSLCVLALAALATGIPLTASALDNHTWFWTTANDANPLPYSECQRRAAPALSAVGLSAVPDFSNPDTFRGESDTVHVMLMCIPLSRGFYMVLDVAVSGGSVSSAAIGQAVGNAFWGTGGSTTGTGGSDWSAQANQFRGHNGTRYTYSCPPNGTISGRLWGTDLYTDDSSVCTAAVHAGLINTTGGGTVTIEIRDGASSYQGSTRYGVTSYSYGSWSGSFVFVS